MRRRQIPRAARSSYMQQRSRGVAAKALLEIRIQGFDHSMRFDAIRTGALAAVQETASQEVIVD